MAAVATLPARSADRPSRALSMTELLTLALVAACPLVNVLGPMSWLPPPMMAGLALLGWLAIHGRLRLDRMLGAWVLLAVLSFLPWLYSAQYITMKTLSHAAAILCSVGVYYAALRSGLLHLVAARGVRIVLEVLYAALVATSAFILLEFVGTNTGLWDVSSFVPYIDAPNYAALVFWVIYRPRGFASEPGVMALFYDLALFAVLPLLAGSRARRLLYVLVVVPAYLSLFSTASLLAVGAGCLLLWLWNVRHRFLRSGRQALLVGALLVATAAAFGTQARDIADVLIFSRVGALITGSSDVSGADRRGRLEEAADIAAHYPLGIGFGIAPGIEQAGGSYRGWPISEGQVSLVATFLVSGGIAVAALVVLLIVDSVVRAVRIAVYGPTLAAGGLALAVHHVVITEYWLPFLWMFFALTDVLARQRTDAAAAA